MNTMIEKKKKKQEVGGDDFITLEILSRLPVNSLMRFKCVCKHWQSMIHKDKFFIDLHLALSITAIRTSFLLIGKPINGRRDRMCLLTAELLMRSSEEDGCAEVGAICLWEPPIQREHDVSVCTLNGLICFVDKETSCALIYNSSTREATTWIKSTVKEHEDENMEKYTSQDLHANEMVIFLMKGWGSKEKQLMFRKNEFGYDPATKEHKVIALWELKSYGSPTGVFFFEVMTVGQNSWRRIDGIDPSISPLRFGSSVYLNGSIYFLCQLKDENEEEDEDEDYGLLALYIIEFNVGSEKFRLLDRLAHSIFGRDIYTTDLIKVNGRLCVLSYNTRKTSIVMRTLLDLEENVQDKNRRISASSSTKMSSNSAAGNSNYHWFEETILLPHDVELYFYRQIPEMNLFIIGSVDDDISFYHYNQKNKSYSISKITSEIFTKLGDKYSQHRYSFDFFNFTPYLLPVN